MIQVTGPAVAIVLVVGYLGVNVIATWIGDQLFKKAKERDEDK